MIHKLATCLIFCAFSSALIAQNSAPTDSAINYQATFFQTRAPDFFRVFKNRKPFPLEKTAKIFSGPSQTIVELFWQSDTLGKNEYRLVVVYPDNTANVTQIWDPGLQSDSDVAKVYIRLSSNRVQRSFLELRVLHSNNILLYRWLGSNWSEVSQGAQPIVEKTPVSIGELLPPFSASTLGGDIVSTDKFRGQILVINTWAIGCSGCVAEMPGLNKLFQMHKSQNISFVAIGFDPAPDLQSFLKKNPFSYTQLLRNSVTDSLLNTGGPWPRNTIVNQNGIVVYDQFGGGDSTYVELNKEIEKLLINGN